MYSFRQALRGAGLLAHLIGEHLLVTVREGNLVREVRVWRDDAVASGLAPFETRVLALARRLSADEVLTTPAAR